MPKASTKIRSIILATCEDVARSQRKELAPLRDDLPLLDSGLDSLCLAVIVARLEDLLGFDPFDTDREIEFPVTVGDFIGIYETSGRPNAEQVADDEAGE